MRLSDGSVGREGATGERGRRPNRGEILGDTGLLRPAPTQGAACSEANRPADAEPSAPCRLAPGARILARARTGRARPAPAATVRHNGWCAADVDLKHTLRGEMPARPGL